MCVYHRETQPSQGVPLDLVGANENVANTVDIETSDQSTNLTALSAAANNASNNRCSGLCVCVWSSNGVGREGAGGRVSENMAHCHTLKKSWGRSLDQLEMSVGDVPLQVNEAFQRT